MHGFFVKGEGIMQIREISAAQLPAYLDQLVVLLQICVQDGASIGFLRPCSEAQARHFWQQTDAALAGGARRLLLACDQNGVAGAVQVVLAMPDNGQHRAEIAKLMVHPVARRRGLARLLMLQAEQVAREENRQLLVLDTRCGDAAEQLYLSLGYQLAGQIPGYALSSDGHYAATSFMYKRLAGAHHQIRAVDPGHADALALLGQLSATLAAITGDSGQASFDADDVRGPAALFVLACDADGRAVGCGAFRPLEQGVAELKRMYAQPGTSGVGAAILAHLEGAARALGYHALRLETRLVNQHAVLFYEKHGYRRIPNFGKYVGRAEAVCFEKLLR